MSKLPKQHQFVDLSDYGRPVARWIAESIKHTSLTPIHVSIGFIISGLLAIFCMLNHFYWWSAFFLIFKSILDAADGELARIKKQPSYTGRYFDSISDFVLNFLFLLTIWYITKGSILFTIIAFFGIHLQGSLYNYYYVILRNKFNKDETSRVFESETPIAMKGENQETVNVMFKLFTLCYGFFDKTVYFLDKNAVSGNDLPNWFMSAISTFGLGFQLLIISLMLVLGLANYIIPFFVGYSFFIFVFIGIRKSLV